jgi:hypothetical protein
MKKVALISLCILSNLVFLFAQSTPENDKCDKAIPLTIIPYEDNVSTNKGTTQGATFEEIKGCPEFNSYKDVWYTFEATQSRHLIKVESDDLSFQILKGNCDSLSAPFCSDYDGAAVFNTIIGQKYFIRIYHWQDKPFSFNVSVSEVPGKTLNTQCEKAFPLTVTSNQPCQNPLLADLITAQPDFIVGKFSNVLWYKFEAQSPYDEIMLSDVVNTIGATQKKLGYFVFEENCADLTIVAESKNTEMFRYKHFVKGKNYLIAVVSESDIFFKYKICVTNPNREEHNDFCENAFPTIVSPNSSLAKPSFANFNRAYQQLYDVQGSFKVKKLWFSCKAEAAAQVLTIKNIAKSKGDGFGIEVYQNDCNDLEYVSRAYIVAKNDSTANIVGLIKGHFYKVVLLGAEGENATFELYFSTPELTSNDEKNQAITLLQNPSMMPEQSLSFSFEKASPSSDKGCFSQFSDLWYRFTAAETKYFLKLYNTNNGNAPQTHVIQLLNDTFDKCIYQNQNTDYFPLENLIVGQKYWIRLYNYNVDKGNIALLTPQTPVNDDFAKATLLKISLSEPCTSVSGSTLFASPSPTFLSDDKKDVWYKFVAVANTHIINLQNIKFADKSQNSWFSKIFVQLYTKEDYDKGQYFSEDKDITRDLVGYGNLEIGKTYYLRISNGKSDFNAIFFDICIGSLETEAKNLDCNHAVNLLVNTNADVNPANYVKATLPFDGAVHSGNLKDLLWFKFTATSNQHIVKVYKNDDLNNFSYQKIEIYKGENCQKLSKSFSQYSGSFRFDTQKDSTYYLCFYPDFWNNNSKTQFRMAVSTPVAAQKNNDCNEAELLVIQNGFPTQFSKGNLIGATSSFQSGGIDVWYKFIAKAKSHKLYFKSKNARVSNLYSACSSFSHLSSLNSEDSIYTLKNLTPNQEYLIRLDCSSSDENESDYTIALFDAEAINDDCISALPLTIYTENQPVTLTTVDTRFATLSDNKSQYSACFSSLPKDIWYRFTATAKSIRVQVNGKISTLSIFDFKDGNCDAMKEFDCRKLENPPNPNVDFKGLVIGRNYLLQVANVETTATIALVAQANIVSPQNDNFADAELLIPNTDAYCIKTIKGTLYNATKEDLKPGETSGSNGSNTIDIWYKFQAIDIRQDISLKRLNTKPDWSSEYMQLYAYNNGVLSLIENMNNASEGKSRLEIGQTYYLKVYRTSSTLPDATHEIELCITSPYAKNKANDLVCNAINIPVINEGELIPTERYNTDKISEQLVNTNSSNCFSQLEYYQDMWFKFKAGSKEAVLVLDNMKDDYDQKVADRLFVAIYKGDCKSSLQVVTCASILKKNRLYMENLVPNEEYIIRIINQYVHQFSSFGIYVQKIGNLPAKVTNDDCTNPMTLTVNEGYKADAIYTVHNYLATPSANDIKTLCDNSTNKREDIWFDFVATQAQHIIVIDPLRPVLAQQDIEDLSALRIDLYEGNCNALISKNCESMFGDSRNSLNIKDLEKGKRYLIRIHFNEDMQYIAKWQYFNITIAAPTKALPENIECYNSPMINMLTTAPYATIEGSLLTRINWYKEFGACFRFKPKTPLIVFEIPDKAAAEYIKINLENANFSTISGFSKSLHVFKVDTSKTYCVQFFSSKMMNFKAILKPYEGKINATCENAKTIPLNPSMKLNQYLLDTIAIASSNTIAVFYEFTATHTTHYLYFKPINKENYNFTINKGCSINSSSNMTALGGGYFRLDKLEIGKNVKINISGYNLNVYALIAALTQPTWAKNDECTDASLLYFNTAVCTNPSFFVHKAASSDKVNPTEKCTDVKLTYQSLWYSFKPTATNATLTISNIKRNRAIGDDASVTLFQADNCQNQSAIQCNTVGFLDGQKVAIQYENLALDKSYQLRISLLDRFPTDSTTYNLCINSTDKNFNKDCATAQSITVNSNNAQISDKYKGSFDAAPEVPLVFTCGQSNRSLWLKFVATQSKIAIVVKGDNYASVSTQIHSGSCNNLKAIKCIYSDTLTILESLITGATYYIELQTKYDSKAPNVECHLFNVLTPSNDLCQNATPLTLGAAASQAKYIKGTNTWAIEGKTTACNYDKVRDVWYSFVPTTNQARILFSSEAYQLQKQQLYSIGIFSGFCLNLKEINCLTEPADSSHSGLLLSGLTPNTTYYLNVQTSRPLGKIADIFQIAVVNDTKIAPNTICSSALDVPVSETPQVKQYLAYDSKYLPLTNYTKNNGNQGIAWFSFVAKSKTHKVIFDDIISDNEYSLYLEPSYYSSDCKSINPSVIQPSSEGSLVNLIVGKTYYIHLLIKKYSKGTDKGLRNVAATFKIGIISLPDAPDNDLETNPKKLIISTDYNCTQSQNGTTYLATGFLGSVNSCEVGKDVWYSFTPQESGKVVIDIKNIRVVQGFVFNPRYQVSKLSSFSTPQNPNLLPIDCASPFDSKVWEVEAKETYYIRVHNKDYNESRISFDICVRSALPYDELENALLINTSLGNTTICNDWTTQGASVSEAPAFPLESCNLNTPPKDVWLKHISQGTTLTIQVKNKSGSGEPTIAIYKQKNGRLQSLIHLCSIDSIVGLNKGDTLYLRIWETENIGHNYQICLKTKNIVSTNNQSINNSNIGDLLLYPNPANEILTVQSDLFSQENTVIEIFNLQGQLILKLSSIELQNIQRISIAYLQQAAYILKISNKEHYQSKIFIKE